MARRSCGRTPSSRGAARGGTPLAARPAHRRRVGMPRERRRGGSLRSFAPQRTQGGSRTRPGRCRMVAVSFQFAPGLFSRRRRGGTPGRRRDFHSSPARLRKANGNRLFRRSRAMHAFPDMMDGLAHKFSGLRRGGLSLALRLPGPFKSSVFWHDPLSWFPGASLRTLGSPSAARVPAPWTRRVQESVEQLRPSRLF
jgi:hypothetical protein